MREIDGQCTLRNELIAQSFVRRRKAHFDVFLMACMYIETRGLRMNITRFLLY
jgi:hypothetical protein